MNDVISVELVNLNPKVNPWLDGQSTLSENSNDLQWNNLI